MSISTKGYPFDARIYKELPTFPCDICEKIFQFRSQLIEHKMIHTPGQRTIGCHICSKTFADPSNLKIHMRIHTSLSPHECFLCGKSFGSKSELTFHIRHGMKKAVHEKTESSKTKPGNGVLRAEDFIEKSHNLHCLNIYNLDASGESCIGIHERILKKGFAILPKCPGRQTLKRIIPCMICGKTLSASWLDVDVGDGDQIRFCGLCQKVLIRCALCDHQVECCSLRTHLGKHTGEVLSGINQKNINFVVI